MAVDMTNWTHEDVMAIMFRTNRAKDCHQTTVTICTAFDHDQIDAKIMLGNAELRTHGCSIRLRNDARAFEGF